MDAVEPECPYIMNDEYLRYIFDKWKVDYVVHGDDPCIVDGKGASQCFNRAKAQLSFVLIVKALEFACAP